MMIQREVTLPKECTMSRHHMIHSEFPAICVAALFTEGLEGRILCDPLKLCEQWGLVVSRHRSLISRKDRQHLIIRSEVLVAYCRSNGVMDSFPVYIYHQWTHAIHWRSACSLPLSKNISYNLPTSSVHASSCLLTTVNPRWNTWDAGTRKWRPVPDGLSHWWLKELSQIASQRSS